MPQGDPLELFRLRTEYPPGTPCWYYPAGEPERACQGWVSSWSWRDGSAQVHLVGGGSVPLDQLVFDNPTPRSWSADATNADVTPRGRP